MADLSAMEIPGLFRLLLALSEKERHITELLKRKTNPQGFISQDNLRKSREVLQRLNLATEVLEEGPRPKTFIWISEKGRRVAGLIEKIVEELESS